MIYHGRGILTPSLFVSHSLDRSAIHAVYVKADVFRNFGSFVVQLNRQGSKRERTVADSDFALWFSQLYCTATLIPRTEIFPCIKVRSFAPFEEPIYVETHPFHDAIGAPTSPTSPESPPSAAVEVCMRRTAGSNPRSIRYALAASPRSSPCSLYLKVLSPPLLICRQMWSLVS